MEKGYPLSKTKEEEKVPTPSCHGTTHRPSQNRTSDARKRSDGCPIPNDECLFGCDRVEFEEIHGITSSRGSFLLFQRGFMFSSKNYDHQKNRTITAKKEFLRSDYLVQQLKFVVNGLTGRLLGSIQLLPIDCDMSFNYSRPSHKNMCLKVFLLKCEFKYICR